jgi:uncharacterized protein
MLKYLLLVLALIWLFYSPALRSLRHGSHGQQPRRPHSAAPPKTETMVECAHCHIHLPAGEAMRDSQGRAFCNPAHLRAGPHD